MRDALRLIVLTAVAAWAGCVRTTVVTRPSLVGTWRLVEFWDRDEDGKLHYRFGEHPRGYLVFDSSGHVFVQYVRDPLLPRLTQEALNNASRDTLLETIYSYGAYFGAVTVDSLRSEYTQVVEAHSSRIFGGVPATIKYRVVGDSLFLEVGPMHRRAFVRAR